MYLNEGRKRMSYIELKDITKSYHAGNNILEQINLTIEKGEFFVLVGPSGSGKSTLLRMIAGLEVITDGVLKMNSKGLHILPIVSVWIQNCQTRLNPNTNAMTAG